MNFNSFYWLGLGLSMTLAFSSCKKDEVEDPIIPNEEEIITTLELTLTPDGGGTPILMSFQDNDGDGPQEPVISVSDTLLANTQYGASLILLNETVSPVDTINFEILDEAEDHQFFFVADGVDVDVMYDDSDADGNPLGLEATFDSGAASAGTLRVVLRHEPDKTATGVAAGDITNAGGETDIEATFDVLIQ